MKDLNPRHANQKSDALPTELTGHTVTTRENIYLTVKVSRRKNVNMKLGVTLRLKA